ncbi:MAG: hypothetical protein NXH72_14540 [Hyphomonadaceae bacterium]|nr:hypothetical protein [Hyphomonadaceae bacterium]
MTLEAIYYIGQTVAVVAILASLGAIWLQMRQGHKIARAEASNQFRLAYQNLTLRMVDDKELSHGFNVLVVQRGRLDDEVTLNRMMGWFGAYSNLYHDAVDANAKGLLDDWLFFEIENAWAQYLTIPVVWKWQLRIVGMRPSTELSRDVVANWAKLREQALAKMSEQTGWALKGQRLSQETP